jgi:predicted deacylase
VTELRELSPGQVAWTTLSVDLGLDEPLTLDVFLARGKQLKPLVLVTAGIHGDEYEGPDAVASLAQELRPAGLAGSVMAIPVVNPMAFAAGQRLSPVDGKNLARSFPGRPEGSPTERLAYAVFESFARSATHLIDLHSGGVAYRFIPVAGFYGPASPENPSYADARRFGLKHLWSLPETAGVLSCEAWKLGLTAIGCEYLGAGQLAAEGSAAYVRGIMSCLAAWGVTPDGASLAETGEAFENDWQVATVDGLFHVYREVGDSVRPGDVVAVTTDLRGKTVQTFSAPCEGVVLALRSKAWLCKGDWGVLVGRPCTR